MNLLHPRRNRRLDSFTLIELLVVIAIIGLMAGLAFPSFQSAMLKARSIACAGNLRQIGVAAMQAATDNNNCYPLIDQASQEIYPAGTPGVTNMIGALGPYGVTTNTLECPIDMAQGNSSSFKKYGSSYEWDPVFDSEPVNATAVYLPPGFMGGRIVGTNPNGGGYVAIPVNSARVRLAMDFNPVHHNRPNVVYGDGHVSEH
jgi:prepilin-type N-terminal cleavage/methylation domain-containing protein/prepilin-type processing-associated H-X9-DG protein